VLPLIAYHISYYTKSYRYLAPLIAYVGFLLFIYTLSPNPVMESYAFSSVWLFAVAAWIAYGFADLEPGNQQPVTVSHVGSASAYHLSKLLTLLLIGALFSSFAVLYPTLAGKFDRSPSMEEGIFAWVAHIGMYLLGTGCALWFTERGFGKTQASLPAMIGVLVLSLASGKALERLPDAFHFVRWLLPPAGIVSEVLTRQDRYAGWETTGALMYAITYGVLICGGYILRAARKKF